MDADLWRHLHGARALGAEGALEDLDHLGAGQADGLHVGAAEVADAVARHRRERTWSDDRGRRGTSLLPRQTAHMRALFASTRGAGHFNPLVPFARAFERAGHELLFAGPADLAGAVEAAGFEFWQFDAPPEDELGAVWSRVPELPPDEANEVVVGEVFGRLNTTAALPRLREACEEWWPDVVVRDPNEYGSALAAELHGIPHARAAIGLASTEEVGLGIAASAIDAIRREQGLPPDPGGDALRDSPYLSVFPASLDEGGQPQVHRFRDPDWDAPAAELPDWWPGRE